MPLARSWAVFTMLFVSILTFSQQPEGRLMRFPDIHGDKIAFVYGGDIWLASASGGAARRITTHPGRELFPKFSPDGKWIAFTGQYDGNFNVYVMSSEGSQPRQLTFYQGAPQQLNDRMGIHNQVLTWTPDSKRILFLTRRDASNGWTKRQFTVSIDGGLPQPLSPDQGGLTSYNADGTKIAYNRIFRNFRTWKRYTGGLAQDIYIYDLKNNVFEQQIPHTDYTDTFPMWHGNTVYFTSDRGADHRFNIYSYDLGTKQIEQVTHFTDFDVMWPSLGDASIIFENGGYLYVMDLTTRQANKLTITLPGERDLTMKHWASVNKFITDFDIAPDGKRAVFAARGDVFTVPAKEGATRNLTRTSGSREKGVAWSPDGRWIAFVSDRTGEDELYITPQDGMGNVELARENQPKDRDKDAEKQKDKEAAAREALREKERGKDKEQQITSGYKGFKFPPVWSPDSKRLAWADKDLRLWYVDIDDKKPVEVDRGKYNEITNYSWSPDSKWLAYDKQQQSGLSIVYLYSTVDKKITAVTGDLVNSSQAAFDPQGNYLYFLSDRDYNEVIGTFDFEFTNPKTTRPYLLTLHADAPSPFPALSDETTIKPWETVSESSESEKDKARDVEEKDKTADRKDEARKVAQKTDAAKREKESQEVARNFHIDLENIQNRIVALPVPPAVITQLTAARGFLYYSTQPVQGLSGPIPGEEPAIHAYDMKERKEKTIIEGIDHWALSFDGTKILYQAKETYGIMDAKLDGPAPKKPGEGALNVGNMRAEIDPPAEWKQIFNEVWRQERDYFFEASMNGVNWEAIRDKYAPLVAYAANRYDLTYIMGEVIGELSNSHTYVGGGDQPDLHPVNVGLLGVDFELDAASGLYRFTKIYPGQNWDPQMRSPLTEPGVNVKEGDYLLAVNGRPLRAPQNPYELFVNTANETTAITVNSKPDAAAARTVPVKPIPDEYPLREFNMVENNRKKVDAATHGRVGYIYLPDMGDAGLNAFVRQFFPQIRKEGLIIDVRYNGGGFVDQLIFERLRRILAGMDAARNFESTTTPPVVFHGYLACITNQYAASDGDIFSEFFKVYKLGPLIGERTWGGVRGIRGDIALIDGGYITRPEFSDYGLDSKWVVENRGVAPDIEVDNRPDDVVRGKDAQLDRAIQEVMKQIEASPKKLPPRPPDLPAYPEGPAM